MIFDLHTHSNASDGLLSPANLLDLAVHTGLRGLALTDHDTLDGWSAAKLYHEQAGLPLALLLGIELNTEFEGEEVHILGYGIDGQHPALCARLAELRCLRRERAAKMVEQLQKIGLQITMEAVEKRSQGNQIGRPHVAMVLVDQGYTVSIAQGFKEYLAKGRPGYVPRYEFEPDEAIALIKAASGLPVLAHPGLIRRQSQLEDILAMGVKGIECYYPKHSWQQTRYYRQLAENRELAITGGSDFHGAGSGESRDILGVTGLREEDFKIFFGKIKS